jgi:hypothetical protein
VQSIENRVAALEAKASAADGALKFVWMEQGETEADALKRAGYSPEDIGTGRVLTVSWLDAKL